MARGPWGRGARLVNASGPPCEHARVIWCRTCGQPWRALPDLTACPRCGEASRVPARGLLEPWLRLALGEGELPLTRRARLLLRLALLPPTLPALHELRRCADCEEEVFHLPAPCPACGGETVGLDPDSVADGTDLLAQRATALRGPGRPFLLLAGLLWLLAAVQVGRAFAHYGGPIRPLLALAGWSFLAVWSHVALVLPWRAWRRVRAGRPLPGPAPQDLQRARRELLFPFLDRHAIEERGALARAERELPLLERALADAGLALPAGRLRPLLVSCALERDLARLGRRLEEERARVPEGDGVLAFARLVDPGADEALAPRLSALLARRAEPLAGLPARLRAARERLRQEGFVRDLERRRKAGEG